jgi:hypothetical protein
MLILNMFIYKLFYEKNSEDSNFQSNYLVHTHTHKWIHVYILEKNLRMKGFFRFGQSMKKTIMVKVGYLMQPQVPS